MPIVHCMNWLVCAPVVLPLVCSLSRDGGQLELEIEQPLCSLEPHLNAAYSFGSFLR